MDHLLDLLHLLDHRIKLSKLLLLFVLDIVARSHMLLRCYLRLLVHLLLPRGLILLELIELLFKRLILLDDLLHLFSPLRIVSRLAADVPGFLLGHRFRHSCSEFTVVDYLLRLINTSLLVFVDLDVVFAI